MAPRTTHDSLCGFCQTGHHDRCAGIVRNGNGSIWRCSCEVEACGQNRCLACQEYGDDLVSAQGVCLDAESCATKVEKNTRAAKERLGVLFDHVEQLGVDSSSSRKNRSRRKNNMADVKGTAWLTETVNEKAGKNFEGKTLRAALRKLAADGTIEKPDGRWTFTGLNDPAVKALIKQAKAGELDPKPRGEGLKKAHEARRAKAAAKKAEEAEEAEVIEEEEDDEVEDLDDEL